MRAGWWEFLNPFSYLGEAVAEAVTGIWTMMMMALWNSGLWVLRLEFTVIDALTTPDLTATGPIASAYQITFWLAGALVLTRMPLQTAAIVPLLSIAALAYRNLKRLPLAKNVFVPLVWTWATIALPFPDGSWFGWRWIAEPIAPPLFLLLTAGVLLCDLKDEPHDRRAGVASLAVVVGGQRAAWIGVGLGLVAGVAAYLEHRSGLAVSAFGLSVTALWPRLLATDVVGPLVVDVILSVPGFLIASHLV